MLSEDKISHLSHVIFQGLKEKKSILPKAADGAIRKEIKRAILTQVKIGEDMDSTVREKLKSYSRKLVEGSPEWEVLYRKFYKEEEVRRGRDLA